METEDCMNSWKKGIKKIIDNNTIITSMSGRKYYELENLKLIINNPNKDIDEVLIKVSELPIFYPSKEELKKFILNKNRIPGFSYTYGRRIFNYGSNKINQFDDFIIPLLKSNPNSKRAIVNLWEPKYDSKSYKKDTPSFILISFRLINDKLNITTITRSLDFIFGWPSHIYQTIVLQEYITKKLIKTYPNIQPGKITNLILNALIFKELEEYTNKILN